MPRELVPDLCSLNGSMVQVHSPFYPAVEARLICAGLVTTEMPENGIKSELRDTRQKQQRANCENVWCHPSIKIQITLFKVTGPSSTPRKAWVWTGAGLPVAAAVVAAAVGAGAHAWTPRCGIF